ILMTVAMRYELRWKLRQILRYMFKMGDSDGEHHAAGLDRFSIIQSQSKTVCHTLDAGYQFVLKFRHHAIPESQSVIAEGIEPDRDPHVRVLDAALRTELFQREFAVGIVDVRSEPVRFEHHAFRHVRQPAIHGAAKNAERDAATAEMCCDGKSVGTCADNCSFDHKVKDHLSGFSVDFGFSYRLASNLQYWPLIGPVSRQRFRPVTTLICLCTQHKAILMPLGQPVTAIE